MPRRTGDRLLSPVFQRHKRQATKGDGLSHDGSSARRPMHRATFVVFACCAFSGLAADGPQFEVASVKPAAPMPPGMGMRVGSRGGPGTSDPGQVTYVNLTLKNLLTTAHGVKIYQVSGPGWLDTERYDIAAKMPPDTTKEQFALMLQNLLAERFKLTLHHETKDLPLYELVVGRNGPKLKPWVEDPNAPPPPSPGTPPPLGKDGRPIVSPGQTMMSVSMNNGVQRMRLTTTKQSLARFADMLANQLGRPVVDKTGLIGEFNDDLEYSPDGLSGAGGGLLPPLPPPPPGAGGPPGTSPAGDQDGAPSLITAIQEQLGLRLESKKEPLDLLVIDHADKTPMEN
jgi:uncharacterized protein (TIGR03435 family)